MRLFASVEAVLVSAAIFSGAAAAADLPTKAPAFATHIYDWTGLYIGLNGGGASSHECWTIYSVAGAPVTANSEGCHNATGALLGGQLGYRWQITNWVFGVEAQGDWVNLKGSNSSLTATTPYMNQTKVTSLGLFTGQVGYAFDNVLWYVKGGVAVTHNDYSSYFTATGVVFNQASEDRWGGAFGTGIEYGFAPNWSVGVEYDHLFMGTKSVTFPATAIAVTRSDNIQQGVDMGLVRLDYRFNGANFSSH